MISKYTYKGLVWVDLESPSTDELVHVAQIHGFEELITNNVVTSNNYSQFDAFPSHMHLILPFPHVSTEDLQTIEKKVRFIIGNDYIITVHDGPIDAFQEFAKAVEVEAILDTNNSTNTIGFLFRKMLQLLYIDIGSRLNKFKIMLHELEESIGYKKRGEATMYVLRVDNAVLRFKKALDLHKDVLASLNLSSHFFNEKFDEHMSIIVDEYDKAHTTLGAYTGAAYRLGKVYELARKSKTFSTLKAFTQIVFFTSLIGIICLILVLNQNSNIITSNEQYYEVFGILLLTYLLIYINLKSKKWL